MTVAEMVQQIEMEVQEILKQCTVEGNVVKLPGVQLEKDVYNQVKKKLELIGGKWKGGKVYGFVFEFDPKSLLEDLAAGDNRNLKKEYQFFPTPKDVAVEMMSLLRDIYKPGMTILEPSAGDGALIKAFFSMYGPAYAPITFDCFELMDLNRKKIGMLQEREPKCIISVLGEDFLLCDKVNYYDIVIANPPFSKNADIDHILKMYEVCKPGGTILTLSSQSWYNGSQKKQQEFRDWLEDLEAYPFTLPLKSFQESGTNIAPLRLMIKKPVEVLLSNKIPTSNNSNMKKATAKNKVEEAPMVVTQAGNLVTEFRMVPVQSITPDSTQPRKFFDELAMNELIESVKKNGVLQPVMVRTVPGSDSFLLVCGERRYRSAVAAGLTEIPAVIRTLTDAESLEIQIIENLQRKDVHPMEEAVAFKSLKEKGFDVEEIAAKVGKAPSFVAQRVKLNDLIDDYQEMLFMNKMNVSQAVQLCRLSPKDQTEIFNEQVKWKKNWKTDKEFHLESVDRYVKDAQNDLSKAPFKTNDPNLYPEMGACNTCPFNTSNNQLLFPELNKKRLCTNSICYQIKCDRGYQIGIQKAMEDPEMLFVNCSNWNDDSQKKKIKAAQEIGAVVLNENLFKRLVKPEHPGTWEEHLKKNDDWSDDDDMDEEEKNEMLADCKEEYNNAVEEYEEELADYERATTSGEVRKAFVIIGDYNTKDGTVIDIIIRPKKAEKLTIPDGSSDANIKIQQDAEIAAIKEREARNKELDREKVYKRALPELKEQFIANTDPLHPEELKALILMVVDTSYKARDFAEAKFELGNDWNRLNLYKKLPQNIKVDDQLLAQLVRIALYDRLVDINNGADFGKYGKAAIMMDIAKLWMSDKVQLFEIEQQEKAAKRIQNVNKKIAALKPKAEKA